MKQYIYSNIEKKGYIYLSSDPNFFLDPKKAKAMPHLICYDTTCGHGKLPPGAHQCYWMLTTNLNIPGEEPHLFLQASGFHPDRGAIYAHGFISDSSDKDLYGPQLLMLMKTPFHSGQAIANLKTTYVPQDISCNNLPVVSLGPWKLPTETLEVLLDTLLRGRKLILRLPQTGQAAMTASRELLLNLYARLPYALRRTNGFVTGMSSHKLLDSANTLPAAITIYLMDGDADGGGLPPLGTEYFVLSEEGNLSGGTGKSLPQVHSNLAAYLASESPEELDKFFSFCQQLTNLAAGAFIPNISNYELFYFFHTLGNQNTQDITDEQIRLCAANLCSVDDKMKNLRTELYRRVAGVLSPQRLARYLCDKVADFNDLESLGIPDPKEQTAILAGAIDQVKDTHAALTLRLAQTYYTRDEDIQTLLAPLSAKFVELACQSNPCLTEAAPTAKTIQCLDAISLADTSGGNIKEQLINRVRGELRGKQAAILSKYEENRRTQLQQGLEIVQSWPLMDALDNLKELFATLEEKYYLHAELMPEWNRAIGKKLVDACNTAIAETAAEYGRLVESAKSLQTLFQSKGGVFSNEQKSETDKQMERWSKIYDMSQKDCPNIQTLLNRFEQIDSVQMPPQISEELKRLFADHVFFTSLTDEEICGCVHRLAENNTDDLERELLLPALTESLRTFAPDLPLSSIKARLQAAKQLEDLQLFAWLVDFRPWNCEDKASHLLNTLTTLENYGPGKSVPALENLTLRRWAAEHLKNNMELMYLLAKRDPCLGSEILSQLAKKYRTIQESQLRCLYLAGWSRESLCAAGVGEASKDWQDALDKVFPQWVELPPPAFLKPPDSGSMNPARLLVPPILLGLIGILLTAIPAVVGFLSFSLVAGSATVLALGAFGCFTAALLPLQQNQKTLLYRFALALLTGVLVAAITLILLITSIL